MWHNFREQLIYCLINFYCLLISHNNHLFFQILPDWCVFSCHCKNAKDSLAPKQFKAVNRYWISFFCHSIVFPCHVSIFFLNIIPPPNLSPLHYSLDVWNYTCSKYSVAIWTQGRSIWQLMPTVLMCMTQTKTNYLWYVDETFAVMHFISLVINDNPSRYWPYFILLIVQEHDSLFKV